ncbi:coatomer gamma subunit appendage domain protein [Dictyocaulus viviparus]|uniref:Coatomer subunit gamma n=1 Tax=Dictyocaulus viviparus TaxID=29172 RepID=A0A0D8XLX8_DICVI|nr:coatomer gamma subunit appendage domain protein [Dictyocaulus viviparus]
MPVGRFSTIVQAKLSLLSTRIMKRDKKDEESSGNPFAHLDKTSVLQEARIFNETPINARKCSIILTKLLYLIQQGETIGRTEATEAFFAVTKLWQSKDANLRRLVYLAVKDLSGIADDVIIVTSSLTKDMTGREDVYRAAAIRALCRITDTGMLQTIERYMKQAIVDKNGAVSSAALVSSKHLMKKSADVVRRWANEVQEAVSSDNLMVQYHALGLLYHIRSNDRLAVNKLVQKFSKSGLRSPHAVCYLIRIAARLINEDDQVESSIFSFIEACLRHKSEMVVYEAASAIVALPNTTPAELTPAISVLQLFCSSPKAALRFAAVRTLNQVSMKHPNAVMSCNVDLEKLITDSNRSIATLAITTLLKTGAESSVERLMKQISSFVSEISDEFKASEIIVVIDAIRSLCGRYPRKHAVMMPFLANMLRNDGGFEYKKAIVETIIAIVEDNPEAKSAVENFSLFDDYFTTTQRCYVPKLDCEHDSLATRVLHLLGREAPKTPNPSSYIRFIYNRVILESTKVRAAAVTALAKFGAQCADLSPSIQVLLKRCLLDSDDEVLPSSLERCLFDYVHGESFNAPFDLRLVPVTSQPLSQPEKRTSILADVLVEKPTVVKKEPYIEQLSQISNFAHLGPLFHSSTPIALTDDVTEYTVSAIKHIFMNHVVIQFDCKNTLNDQLLENVMVQLEDVDGDWMVMDVLPIESLPYNETRSTYVLLEFPESGSVTGTFTATLKFNVKDVDPTTGEAESEDTYEDSYVLEELELCVGDLVVPAAKQNFMSSWEALSEKTTVDETFHLTTVNTLSEAIKKVSELLGLAPCERSDRIPEGKTQHSAMLAGIFRGGFEVLARLNVAIDPVDRSVNMNILIRCQQDEIAELLANAIS